MRWTWTLTLLVALLGCDSKRHAPPPPAESTAAASVEQGQDRPAGTVRFEGVVTLDGEPADRAFLVVSSLASGLVPEGIDPGQLFADAAGRFRIDLPPDRYRIVATRGMGVSSQTTLDLRSDRRDVRLALVRDEGAALDLIQKGPEGVGR